MELWKDIPGYEGIYEASTNGRIRTKKSKTTYTEKHGVRTWKSRILKGRGNNKQTGARVSLWKDGKYKDHLVARLIAYTFLGIPDKKLTVNHKNGNRLDNRLENIEWLTLADNIRHGFENGLYPQHKITLVDNKEISYSFRSFSQANIFLDRSSSYIYSAVKKNNKTVKNKNNEIFTITDYKKHN